MTLFCSGFILIIYMQVQWHQFFDFLFLDLNRKANCLNRNVKSYDNINSFPRISEKIFTYTLIKLAPDSPCDKLFTVHVPGCGGQTVLRGLAHLYPQIASLQYSNTVDGTCSEEQKLSTACQNFTSLSHTCICLQ